MKIYPIGERVILSPIEMQEKTKSGLYLPKTEEKKQGVVVAVGEAHGKTIPLKEGDKILYGGYSSEEIEIDGKKYLIVEFKDILARLVE